MAGPLLGREAGLPSVQYRRPADWRRRPERWRVPCATLMEILDSYQDWRNAIPSGLRIVRRLQLASGPSL